MVQNPLEQAMEAQVRYKAVALYVYSLFNSAQVGGWMVKATPWPFYPREKPGIHCTEYWMDPRASLDRCRKYRPQRHSVPRPSSCSE